MDKNLKILLIVILVAVLGSITYSIAHTHSQNQKTARIEACKASHSELGNPFKGASVPGSCDSNGNFHPTHVAPPVHSKK